MNKFNTFNQTEYLPCLKDIKDILSPKSQEALLQIFPSEVVTILNLIINKYQTKMSTQPKKYQHFFNNILFSTKYVKEQTGLSDLKQKRALKVLQNIYIIEISYYQSPITNYKTRCITLQPKFLQCLNKNLIQKYIKLTSKSNYNLLQIFKMCKKYQEETWEVRYPDYEEELL